MKKLLILLVVSVFMLSALPMPTETALKHIEKKTVSLEEGLSATSLEKQKDPEAEFERAVELIKKYESLHTVAHWPYIGYGHKVRKGEKFGRRNMSEKEATELLRKDLKEMISFFSEYGEDSLMLGVLAYSVGPYRLLGAGKKIAKSRLLEKLESGNRDIREEYLSYSKYKGRTVNSIRQRRIEEFEALFSD